jgi:hypothetical protein
MLGVARSMPDGFSVELLGSAARVSSGLMNIKVDKVFKWRGDREPS